MPNYQYKARDLSGNTVSGVMYAENDAVLRDQLRANKLYLTQFKKTAESGEKGRQSSFRPRKVKLGELVVMSRQMSTLVRAGLPIVEVLSTLRTQTENPILAEAFTQIQQDVLSGSTLHDALARHPLIFNKLYVSLVAAGEAGGLLETTLEIIADQLDKESEIREQVKAALTYPKLVVAACVGVVAFMLVFIVPTFAKVYDQFHAQLPAVTLLLVAMSNAVVHYWWMLLILVFAVYRAFSVYVRTDAGRRNFDRIMLKIPLLGPILRKIAVARFTQTFAGSTKAGIPILNGLAISADTSGNTVIREAILKVAAQVSEGAPLAPTLDESRQFPPLVTRMIAAGEKSGNLDEMLGEITKFFTRDVDYAVGKMTKLIEPLMTVVVGGIVLFVLMALYMPVFNLGAIVKK